MRLGFNWIIHCRRNITKRYKKARVALINSNQISFSYLVRDFELLYSHETIAMVIKWAKYPGKSFQFSLNIYVKVALMFYMKWQTDYTIHITHPISCLISEFKIQKPSWTETMSPLTTIQKLNFAYSFFSVKLFRISFMELPTITTIYEAVCIEHGNIVEYAWAKIGFWNVFKVKTIYIHFEWKC